MFLRFYANPAKMHERIAKEFEGKRIGRQTNGWQTNSSASEWMANEFIGKRMER
jgi:hypothetical protein